MFPLRKTLDMKSFIYVVEEQLKQISIPIHVFLFLKYRSSHAFNLNQGKQHSLENRRGQGLLQ